MSRQYVDPAYFAFGNAFTGGMQQAQEQGRRDELLGIEQQQMQLRNQQFAQQQQMLAEAQKQREAEAQQMQAAKAQYAQLFESVGLDPGLAETPGADELAAHIISEGMKQPEQPKLVEDHTGTLVAEAPGVRPYHAPREPKAAAQPALIMDESGALVPKVAGVRPFIKPKEDKSAQVATGLQLWETALSGLKEGLGGTNTGPIAGRIPAFTAAQQRAESSVAALAPVLKQIFRVAGEGTFTDRDQEMLLNMIPTRKVDEAARDDVIANIDAIVRAKLSVPGAMPARPGQQASGAPKRIAYGSDGKRIK